MLRSALLPCLVLAVACGGSSTQTTTQPAKRAAATPKVSQPTAAALPKVFRSIPSSTPYLLSTNFKTGWSESLTTAFTVTVQVAYEELQKPDFTTDKEELALIKITTDLLGPTLTAKSLTRIGLPASPRLYMYGIGVMPVLRLPLDSGPRLAAAIERYRPLLGDEFPEQQHLDGQGYWHFSFDNDKPAMSMAIAIVGDDLIAGLILNDLKGEMLRALLKPIPHSESLAAAPGTLALLGHHRIAPAELQFVDIARLFAQVNGAVPGLQARISKALIGNQTALSSPVCTSELRRIIAVAPRFVGGLGSAGTRVPDVSYLLELHPDAVHALRSSRAEIPGGDLSQHDAPVAIGIGLDLEQLGVQLKSAADRILKHPFRCSELKEWNQAATLLAKVPVEAVLAQYGSPTGIAAVFSRFDRDKKDAAGAVVIGGRNMAALWQIAAGSIPYLQGVTVPEGDAPVPVGKPNTGSKEAMFAARTQHLIGGAYGTGTDALLGKMMSATPSPSDLLAVLHYDAGANQTAVRAKMMQALVDEGLGAMANEVRKRLGGLPVDSRASVRIRLGKAGLEMRYSVSGKAK